LLAAVAATGVREMEATAFVSSSKVPRLADAAELAAELHNFPASSSPRWSPAPTAPSAQSPPASGRSNTWVSAADGHSRANVGRSTAESTALIPEIVAIAQRQRGFC
jgi:hydroxymethylglutaryl-CoA lyase